MPSLVLYNNINNFSGTNAVLSTVAENDNYIFYGNRWGLSRDFTLAGVLTGLNNYNLLITAQQQLISNFSSDFYPLVIQQDGINLYSGNYIYIKDINFSESPYVNTVPFSIEISTFDQQNWSGVYGILEPREEFNYTEDENGIIQLTHSISAKGFNNSQGALETAKQFVLSRSGIQNKINPLFIVNPFNNPYSLQTVEENFDTLNGTYSLNCNYNSDQLSSGSGVFRYTVTTESGYDLGQTQVTIDGTIDLPLGSSVQALRNRYRQINPYNLANTQYVQIFGVNDLRNTPISSGVVENETERNLSFNVVFNNHAGNLVDVDYTTNIQYDNVSQITTVSLNAEIFGYGPLQQRYARVLDYYISGFDSFALASKDYNQNRGLLIPSYSFFPLNVDADTESANYDTFNGKITYSATWTNKLLPPTPLANWDYSINVKPSILQLSSKPSLEINGYYTVFNLNYYNLEEISIQGSANVLRTDNILQGVEDTENAVNSIISRYTTPNKVLTQNSINTGDPNNRSIGWNVGFKTYSPINQALPKFGNNGTQDGQTYDFI